MAQALTINKRDLMNLTAWPRTDSRPSAEASKHQTTAEVGMRGTVGLQNGVLPRHVSRAHQPIT